MEYRSAVTLLGLPVVHIAVRSVVDGRMRRGVATGWIAIGDVAFGILFSAGGVAVGGVSVGGMAVGALPLGGLAFGALALGGVAIGVIAIGGAAFAWHVAIGGLAVAAHYAEGGVAIARELLVPQSPGVPAFSSIPHAPLRWTDAVWFALIAWGLLRLAWAVQARRRNR